MPFETNDFIDPQIDQEVLNEIMMLGADEAPMLAALLARGVETTQSADVSWFSQDQPSYRTQIDNGGTAYTALTTTLVVDDTSGFRAPGLLYAEATGELLLISQIASATALVVIRGVGGTTAAAGSVANNAGLRWLGSAMGEGSASPDARKYVPTKHVNTVQMFREAVELTGLVERTTSKTENERARQRRNALKKITEDIQRTMIWSSRSDNQVIGGKRIRTMAGLWPAISTNTLAAGGAITKTLLKGWAEGLFAVGSGQKVLFAGATLYDALHTLYEGQVRYQQGETAVGLRLAMIETGYGELLLTLDRSFNGAFEGAGLALDMDAMQIYATEGKQLQLVSDVQQPGEDLVKDEYQFEGTFSWGDESLHGRISGVTGAA